MDVISTYRQVKTFILGRAHNIRDPRIFHKLSLIAFFAWIGLGADGLSSSCYGPEEAFITLQHHIFLGVFVAAATAITVFVIASSYSQIIELFPTGGGGYLVASKLLSPSLGMISEYPYPDVRGMGKLLIALERIHRSGFYHKNIN